ncbi:hypothetical protein CHLNCDRAFT_141275 [Chlorella variabilis]|uniref:Anticodon-binding domain-containing protein n=1 Tax=Chlorella variabilis TaxID=554065 RepID=E1ZSI0_CHLVA|nr:hypothetical protein CHLNCDRAFT_141275 [Chlorella variabilis]EFN51249.1 hypothetical protein CHLNCDRAFT_141275 [Chlorella variabilis]|eukprot:XP_005843351.1 hypothetical protein CHLNCDRAFT_141275 [Chlorella variabilis]
MKDTAAAPDQERKRSRKSDGGAAAATAAAAATLAVAKKHKRRRKAPADATQLSQLELMRRQRQRELRALALRLREQGKVYNAKKHKKHKPRRRVAVIIIPIVWNKKVGEKASILASAEKIQELLRGAGVKADSDTTNELTPGQKMRHWEEKGVMVRVELGSKEVDAGTAVVARCTTPGEVAHKQTVAVGQPLLQLVLRHLEELGIPLQAPAADGASAEQNGAQEEEQQGQGQGPAGPEQQHAQQQQGEQQERPSEKKKKKKAQPSGDDLQGDFDGLPLLPEQSGGKKGKRREQAAAAAAEELAASVFGQPDGTEEREGGRPKKKKHKAVKF